MWNKNRGSGSSGGKPHVIPGHAGYKEGTGMEYNGDEHCTLNNWVISAVSDHANQRIRDNTFQFVREMFQDRLDDDVVQMVLAECDWKEEKAIEHLLALSADPSDSGEKPENQHTLKAIAGWLGAKSHCTVPESSSTETEKNALSYGSFATHQAASPSVCYSTTPLKFAEVLNQGLARVSSNNQTDNLCSISNLGDHKKEVACSQLNAWNSTDQHLQAALVTRPLCTAPLPIMANKNFSSQVNQTISGDFFDKSWRGDKDEVYFSDEETDANILTPLASDDAVQYVPKSSLFMKSDFVTANDRGSEQWAANSLPTGPGLDRLQIHFPGITALSGNHGVSTASCPGFAFPGFMPTPSHGVAFGQSAHCLSGLQNSSNPLRDFHSKDFIMPRFPVQMPAHHLQGEFKHPKLPFPAMSPQNLVTLQATPQSIHPLRSVYNPTMGLVPLQCFASTQPTVQATCSNTTVLSMDEARYKILQLLPNHKTMILLRGCPGSGKTTLAREIKFNGLILSADGFFEKSGKYEYDITKLSEAHAWCKQQALNAVKNGITPIIIDNTNTQAWEMLPYVEMAYDYCYHVEIIEPDVPWRLKAKQLAKYNIHGVPANKLRSMIDRYEHNITAKALLDAVRQKKQAISQASCASPSAKSAQQPSSVPVQKVERSEESEKPQLSKSARKRLKRLKKITAPRNAEVATAGGSNEDEHLHEKEAAAGRSDRESSEKEIVHSIIVPHHVVHLSDSANNIGHEHSYTEKSSTAEVTCSVDLSEEKTRFLEKIKSVKDDFKVSEKKGFADDTVCLNQTGSVFSRYKDVFALDVKDPGEIGYEAEEFENAFQSVSPSEPENSQDVEILEEFEVELDDSQGELEQEDLNYEFSALNISDRELTSEGSDCDASLDKCPVSVASKVDSESGGTLLPPDACSVRQDQPSDVGLSLLPLENAVSLEQDYWSQSKYSKDPYSVQGSLGVESSSAFTCGSWEWDSCDSSSAAATDSYNSNSDKNPETQKNVAETGLPIKPPVLDISSGSEVPASPSPSWHLQREVPSSGQLPVSFTSCHTESPATAREDGSTQTKAKDLTAVHKLTAGDTFKSELFSSVLTARPREIFDRDLAIQRQMELDKKVSLISKRTESTMTDDLQDGNIDVKMDFLSGCFPSVTQDDLQFLLSSCGNDTDLTVNILLDFGFEYNEPTHGAMAYSSVKTPVVMSDCEKLELEPNSNPSDLEEASLVNCGTGNFRPPRQFRAPVSYTLYQDSLRPKVQASEFERNWQRANTKSFKRRAASENRTSDRSAEIKCVMPLTPGFAAQLIEFFGPLEQSCASSGLLSDDDLNVDISLELAKQIYDSWTVSQKLRSHKENHAPDHSLDYVAQVNASSPDHHASSCRIPRSDHRIPEFVPKLQLSAALPDPLANTLSTKIKRQQLKEQYPMINSGILDEIFEATGYSYDITVKTISASPELIAPPKTVTTKRRAEDLELELIERAIVESLKDHCFKGASKKSSFTNGDEVYKDMMSEACTYFSRYQENMKQAQEAHHRKRHQVAMYYSQEASHFKEKFQEAKQLVAEMIMRTRLSDLSNLSSLDLHGFTVQEALNLLETSLSQREDQLATNPDKRRTSLFVITGRGNHSHRGVARIKPAVEAYLKRNNYLYAESSPGILKVRLHVGF